jgi:hypothetical protein
MTVINGATLIDFVVSPDGSMVSINVTDENSKPGSLILPSECLQSLIMSMPEMMQQVLRRRIPGPQPQIGLSTRQLAPGDEYGARQAYPDLVHERPIFGLVHGDRRRAQAICQYGQTNS